MKEIESRDKRHVNNKKRKRENEVKLKGGMKKLLIGNGSANSRNNLATR